VYVWLLVTYKSPTQKTQEGGLQLKVLLGLEKLSLLCPRQKGGLDAVQVYQKSGQNRLGGQAG